MKNLSIKFSSLGYVGIAAIGLIYVQNFKKLYYMPYLQFYDLLVKIYIYVALPSLYFSAAAFLAVVIYTLAPGTIPKLYRRFLLGIALVILLVYAVLLLLIVFIPDSVLFTSAVRRIPSLSLFRAFCLLSAFIKSKKPAPIRMLAFGYCSTSGRLPEIILLFFHLPDR